jgi:hypothetical protein
MKLSINLCVFCIQEIVLDVSLYFPAAEGTPILVTNNMMPTLGTLPDNHIETPERKKETKDIGLSIKRLASKIAGCD